MDTGVIFDSCNQCCKILTALGPRLGYEYLKSSRLISDPICIGDENFIQRFELYRLQTANRDKSCIVPSFVRKIAEKYVFITTDFLNFVYHYP